MTRDELIKQIREAFEYVEYPDVPVYPHEEEPLHPNVNDAWQIAQWLTGRPRESLTDWELYLVAWFGYSLSPEITHYYAPEIMIRTLLTEDCDHLAHAAAYCWFPKRCFNWQQRMAVIRFIEYLAAEDNWYIDEEATELILKWRR